VTGTVYVTTGEWLWSAALSVGLALGSLSTVLIAINNLRDHAEDSQTGKRTLAVRCGTGFARAEIALLTLLAYAVPLIFPLWKNHGLWLLPSAVLGLLIVIQIYRTPPSRVYNRWLALAGLQLILYAILFTISAKLAAA
jgi:1,4-dihydroxy-2-naphthoate polyprenyltransferase